MKIILLFDLFYVNSVQLVESLTGDHRVTRLSLMAGGVTVLCDVTL